MTMQWGEALVNPWQTLQGAAGWGQGGGGGGVSISAQCTACLVTCAGT
jgi:hypothetical protein